MRILFVTPVVPSPAYGRRPYNFLKYLSSRHEVHLAPFVKDARYETSHLERLREWGVQVHEVPRSKILSVAECLTLPFRPDWPLRALYCRSKRMEETVQRVVEKFGIEAIHMDRMRMGQYARGIRGLRKIVDFTDAIGLYLERKRVFNKGIFSKTVDAWERKTIPGFEAYVLDQVDEGLLCSEIDARYFRNHHPDSRVRVIPNVVDPEEFRPSGASSREPVGIFTGTLSYAPNIDALEMLVREILPQVWKTLPDFRVKVFGTRPSRQVRSMVMDKRIELQADVPTLSEHLSERDIYLCPVRLGSGMRNKLLEAMATGMPIVSTPLGAEGLPLDGGRELLLADGPQDFARAVIDLVRDEGLRNRLGISGRDYVLKHHRLEKAGLALESVYLGSY